MGSFGGKEGGDAPRPACRYYGISRQVYYKWLRRYEEGGLDALRDRSSKPHVSPKATRVEVVGKVIYLRQTYHFGPHKIAMYLKRYHDIELSPSGIWRILKRLDMSRLPSSQRYRRHQDRWKRYEKPEPGHRVQVDVKFISPLPGTRRKYYQFTAIDDCTRLRVLRIYDRLNQNTAIQFLDYVLAKLPFRVERIQTDNGASSSQPSTTTCSTAASATSTSDPPPRGSTARSNAPTGSTPRVYRMLDGVVIDDAGVFNERLLEWEDFYNFNRPHGGLGGQTPYERLRQKTGSPV